MDKTMKENMVAKAEGSSIAGRIRGAVIHWGVRVGVAAMVVVVVLVHLHVLSGENLLALLAALILLLSEQLNEAMSRNRKEMEALGKKMAEQSDAVKELIQSTSVRLFGLKECVADLDEALRSVPGGSRVLIQHFGLDMSQAWVYIEPLLRTHPNLTNIDYRLLILTDEIEKLEKLGDFNEELKTWVRNVSWTLQNIKTDISALLREPAQRYRKIKFEVRKYAAVPVVHGFRIVEPDMRCYLAICRWGGFDYHKYEWGEPNYHKFSGESLERIPVTYEHSPHDVRNCRILVG